MRPSRFALILATVLLLLLMLPGVAFAGGINCSDVVGDLTDTYDDVIVDQDCTLNGATVRGSVLVSGDFDLTATGGTTINGSVKVDSNLLGDINLDNVTVLGGVSLKDSGNVTVGTTTTTASIGPLKLENSGTVTVNAGSEVRSIESMTSDTVTISGTTAVDAVVLDVVKVIGSVVSGDALDVTYGTIDGTVSVEKGSGDVSLTNTDMPAGDLVVIEQDGDVSVDNTSRSDASLSDVKVEKTMGGKVTFTNVIIDSDASISDTEGGDVTITGDGAPGIEILGDVEISFAGDVTLQDLRSVGDVKLTSNSGVEVTGNDFGLEDIVISNNSGPVVVDGNTRLSLSVVENTGEVGETLMIKNNPSIIDAEVSKNSYIGDGSISIDGNVFQKLNCSDNSPAPSGSGNNIIELADGQCAPPFNT